MAAVLRLFEKCQRLLNMSKAKPWMASFVGENSNNGFRDSYMYQT